MDVPDYCVCSECDTHDTKSEWIPKRYRFVHRGSTWTATAKFCCEYCHFRFGTRMVRDLRQPRRLLGYVLDRLSHWRKE